MPKPYKDRSMKVANGAEFVPAQNQYFFPKAKGGPVVIIASSPEEAEEILANNK